jgi:hypothetical protein
MTTDDGMLARYLDSANPSRPAATDHLGAIEIPRSIVLVDRERLRIRLVHYEDLYYFIREGLITKLGQRSITYGTKRRAILVFEMDKLRWWRETYKLTRANDEIVLQIADSDGKRNRPVSLPLNAVAIRNNY